MNYKTITYKRTKSLGKHDSEHLELTAEVDSQDDIDAEIQSLKVTVDIALGLIKGNSKNYDKAPF